MKAKKILSWVLSATMILSSFSTLSMADVVDNTAKTQADKQVLSEVVDEFIGFEDGVNGFASSDSSVEVSTTTELKHSGDSGLKINPTGSSKTYLVTKSYADTFAGKKFSVWMNKNSSDRVIAIRLDGGDRVFTDGKTHNADTMFLGMYANSSRFRAYTQYFDQTTNSYQYVKNDSGKVIEFNYNTTEQGWFEFVIDMSMPGEVGFYADDNLLGKIDITDGAYADFRNISFLNSWTNTSGSIYIDDITVSTPLPVANAGEIDDKDDTFKFTPSVLDSDPTAYEYSLDGGLSWTDCTSTTISVGNRYIPKGNVQVRYKVDESKDYVATPLKSEDDFTKYTGSFPVQTEVKQVIDFENGVDGFASTSADISVSTTTDEKHSGNSCLEIKPTGDSATFTVTKSFEESLVGKKVSVWMNKNSSDRTAVLRLDGGERVFVNDRTHNADTMFLGMYTNPERFRAYAQYFDETALLQYVRDENNSVIEFNEANTKHGWFEFVIDMTVSGEVSYYADGELLGTIDTGRDVYADFKNINLVNSWVPSASGTIYIDDITISEPVPAPTNPVVDDAKDTFDWNYAETKQSFTDYEYSTDAGYSWSDCTAKPLYVGNKNYAIGDIQVRVKIPAEDAYTAPLISNGQAYTSTTDVYLSMERVEDIDGFNVLTNVPPVGTNDPATVAPELFLTTQQSHSGLTSLALIPDEINNAPDNATFTDKGGLYKIGNEYEEKVTDKVLTIWMYDNTSETNSNYRAIAITKELNADGTSYSESMVGFNSTNSSNYVIRSKPGTSAEWGTWGNTGVARTTGWHQFQWDYTEEGLCKIYIDGQFVREYASEGMDAYYIQDTWAHSGNDKTFTFYFDDISVTDSREETPVIIPAPTKPVNNDTENTFDWTFVTDYNSAEDYEYSLDSGKTFQNVTEKPINVGDFSYEKGDIIVRVKTTEENVSSAALRNNAEFKSSYFEDFDIMKDTIAFAKGFFKGDYSDETKWNTFVTALAKAESMEANAPKEELATVKTNLDNSIEDLKTCLDVTNSFYNYEELDPTNEKYPFVAVLGTLTKGEALSPHGDHPQEYYADKKGAELATKVVDGKNQSKAIYTFAKPMEDYVVSIPWEMVYSPKGTTELWLLDKSGENGVGVRSRKGTSWIEYLTRKDGVTTTTNANIRMSTNCIFEMQFDFVNADKGGIFTIDNRPVVKMVNGTPVLQNSFAIDSFEQIVFTSVTDVADDFVFDNISLSKKNPAVSVEIADDEIDLGYFDTYNMAEFMLDIKGENSSYPTTDIISYEITSGAEFINVTNEGNIEPMKFGDATVDVVLSSGAKDTIIVHSVDRKAESIMLTTSPMVDIIAMDEPTQLVNNSMPIEKAGVQQLNVGESVLLNAVVTPVGITERLLDWTSSNENVVVVHEGLVTAVNYGNATITATAKDGTKVSATCDIVVTDDTHEYGKEIYVATDGNDTTGDGSIANPYATIEKARDVIASAELPEGGVIVYFREGIYTITKTIEFNENNGGTAERPIKYASYPCEKAVFDGGVNIAMNEMSLVSQGDADYSRLHENAVGKVYRVDISNYNIPDKALQVVGQSAGGVQSTGYFDSMNFSESYYTVTFDGEPMTLARFPNDGQIVDGGAIPGFIRTTRIVDKGKSPRNWETDAILGGWGYAYNEGDENKVFTVESNNYLPAGKLEKWQTALDPDPTREDAGGQGAWMNGYWGTDYSTQTVPLMEINGNDLKSGLISQYGLGQFNGGHIIFYVYNLLEELDIEGEWFIDQFTQEGKKTLYFYPPQGTNMEDDHDFLSIPNLNEVMINIVDANYITFDGIDMTNANAGVFNVAGGDYNTVENSTISNIGGVLSKITNNAQGEIAKFNGFNMCAMKNFDTGVQLSAGDPMTLERGYNYVQNSTLQNFAMQNRSYNPAINLGGVGNRATNNILWDAPHYAIFFNGPESTIEFNEIYDVIYEADDQGAIYTGRDMVNRGTIIRNCYIHGVSADGVDKNTAIYLDDSKSGVLILDNVLENSTLGIKSGGRDVVAIGNKIYNQESGIVADPGGYISTAYSFQHGYNLICSPADYENMTKNPWADPDSAYGRFDYLWAFYQDSPLHHNKYKKFIDNEFINIKRAEDPRATDGYYGVDIWSSYWEQLPFEYMMEEYTYDAIFTKNNNGYDRPEDGLAANPPVVDESLKTKYATTVKASSENGSVFGTKGEMIRGVRQKITATPNVGYEFVNWTNASGEVVSENPIYFYEVSQNETFTANFAEASEPDTYTTVEFVSGYENKVVEVEVKNNVITEEEMPKAFEKLGYTVSWNMTAEEINQALANGETVEVSAVYVEKVETFNVTINGGTGSGDYKATDRIVVKADTAEDGKKFSHWTDSEGEVYGYYPEFTMLISKAVELTAVYVDDAEVVEEKATTTISNTIKTAKGVQFVSEHSVPMGCKIVEAGVIVAIGHVDDLTIDNCKLKSLGKTDSEIYRYTLSVNTTKQLTAVSYLQYTDANGETQTIYGSELVKFN